MMRDFDPDAPRSFLLPLACHMQSFAQDTHVLCRRSLTRLLTKFLPACYVVGAYRAKVWGGYDKQG